MLALSQHITYKKNYRGTLTREDDSNTEDEEDASDGKTVLRVILIDLTVDGGFADQSNSDTDSSP